LLAALASSPERFALARAKPASLRCAIEVAGNSAYLTDLLLHDPQDLEILDSVQPAHPNCEPTLQLEMGLKHFSIPEAFSWASDPRLELREKMAMLRREYRTRVLELGASDLAAGGSPFPMLKRWTANAARCIASALVIARRSWLNENAAPAGSDVPFVILGMGRLGLGEFDLASDADLVFLAGSDAKREDLEHWTHLAERTITVLASYTSDGTLFPVDTRLRPRGQEGELVVTLNELLNYIEENAQGWELLTYLKACPLAGNPQLGEEVVNRLQTAIYKRLLAFRDFEGELHQMRRRLEREVQVPSSNTKTAPGGYYDVEFAVAYSRLQGRVKALPGANMAEQIAALQIAEVISPDDASVLTEGAGFLRSVDHAMRLVTGKAPNGLIETGASAEMTTSVARRWNLIADGQTLAARLHETQQQVRYVYRRLVGSE
jgi:glutamate-ammonia-ligase adenylyltransferase